MSEHRDAFRVARDATVWAEPREEGLYRHLTEHVSSEADLLASYRELAEAPDTPEAARYLIRLIVDDEERHHRLFHEMTAALGSQWAPDPEATPDLPYGPPSRALEEVTIRFPAAEREDQKQLRLETEATPFDALPNIALRALDLARGLCRDSLARGDLRALTSQATLAGELQEFAVSARLLAEG